MADLNIGTLTGVIELEDNLTPGLKIAVTHLAEAAEETSKFGKIVAVSMGTAALAVAGYVTSIVKLGEAGDRIKGVEDAFDRLAKAAGSTGEVLFNALNKGVRATVDSMELMQGANRALAAGVRLTAKDMELLGETARALGKAAGTETAQELETLFRALSSGQTRLLRLKGIIVDTEGAEKKFAASIGTTADQLNAAGKREAARLGILEAMQKRLDLLGKSELTFTERIKQGTVALGNWWDTLSKAIATSPEVNKALDDIGAAFGKILSENGQTAIDTIMAGVNEFAKGVSALAPFVTDLGNRIKDLWNWVVQLNDRFDITGKIVNTVKTLFEGLKTAVVFLVDLARSFWNNLVELNERFGITDKIARGAVIAFNFLKTAFELVKVAANAVVAAWQEMPEWLQKIAAQAISAGVAMTAVGVAAGALASPISNLLSKADLFINIWGNLTGALVMSSTLLKENTLALGLNRVARQINTDVVLLSTTATETLTMWLGLNTVAEKSSSAATAISTGIRKAWNAVLILSKDLVMLVAEKTGLLTLAEALQAQGSVLLSRAKAFLTLTMMNLSAWANTLGLKMGMLSVEEAAAATAAGKLTGANAILAASFGILATAALVVGAAIAGIYLGSMLGEWLFENSEGFRKLSFNIGLAVIALEELNNASIKVGGMTIGFDTEKFDKAMQERVKVHRDMFTANEQLIAQGKKVSGSFDEQAAAHNRLVRELSGADLANRVHKLNEAWLELVKTGQDTPEAMRRTGEAALALMEAGGKLHPQILNLAMMTKALREQAGLVVPQLDKFTKTNEAGTKAALAFADAVGKQAEAIDKLKGLDTIAQGLNLANLSSGLDFSKLPLEGLKNIVQSLTATIDRMKALGMVSGDMIDQLVAMRDAAKLAGDAIEEQSADAITGMKQEVLAVGNRLEAYGDAAAGIVKTEEDADRKIRQLWMSRVAFQLDEIVRSAEKQKDAIRGTTKNWEQLADVIDKEAGAAIAEIVMQTDEWKTAMAAVGLVFPPLLGYLDQLETKVVKVASKTKKAFTDAFTNIASDFVSIISDALIHGTNLEDTAAALGTSIGGSIGGAIGSMFGPLGAALGQTIGSMLGPLLKKLIKSDAERAAAELGREWGVTISGELADSIEETMKTRFKGMANNRWMAEVFHLGDIIREVGLSVDNIGTLNEQLRQSFVFLSEGAMTVKDVTDVLNSSFNEFAEYYTSRNSKISAELREIIRLDDAMGVHSKAVMDFVKSQTNSALNNIGSAIVARGELVDNLIAAEKDLAKARKDSDGGVADVKKIKEAQDAVKKFQAQLAALPLTAGGASAMGSSLLGIFTSMTKSGVGPLEAIRSMAPAIASLEKQLAKAGLSGGAAFDTIKKYSTIATDEIAGPAFTAIHDYGEALKELHNADILTPEMFAGFSEQISATYYAAVDALAKQGKDTSAALDLVSPELQTIWELQQDMGYTVDATTQKLLDEAIAAGKVGDAHRSVQEQMLLATQRIQLAVEGLARAFGVVLPEAAQTGATGIETAIGGAADFTKEQAEDLEIALKNAMLDAAASGVDAGTVISDAMKKAGIVATGPDAIGKIIAFLKTLPGWADLAALGIEEALNSIKVDDIDVGVNVETPKFPDGFPGVPEDWTPDYHDNPDRVVLHSLGGQVPIYAASGMSVFRPRGTDTVPAMLTPGEFVVRAPSVSKVGQSTLEHINSTGTMPPSRLESRHSAEGSGGDVYLVPIRMKDNEDPVSALIRAVPALKKNKQAIRTKFREALEL